MTDVALAGAVPAQVVPGVDVVLPADAALGVSVVHAATVGAGSDNEVAWRPVELDEANRLLAAQHYLGAIRGGRLIFGGVAGDELVAAQVWRKPTSRRLPSDGTWLELSRWCLTPAAGAYAGSRQHRAVVHYLREAMPTVTTLVSYSDPSVGHTGALYRSCNWQWAPTWHRLRTPPTGNGRWKSGGKVEAVKDRWVFRLRSDARRGELLSVDDRGAIRAWLSGAPEHERRWARAGLAPDLREAVA